MTKEEQIGKLKRLGDDVHLCPDRQPLRVPHCHQQAGHHLLHEPFQQAPHRHRRRRGRGQHIKDVIKETHLHEILKDGKARIADLLYIAGKQQVISRIPLKDLHGRILGAVGKGVLNEAVKVAELSKRIEVMDGQLQYYQKTGQRSEGRGDDRGLLGGHRANERERDACAKSNASVLMTGESGTGKEVVAYFIHQNSARANGPFIRVNCASIPRELFESELFGYEGGPSRGPARRESPESSNWPTGDDSCSTRSERCPGPCRQKLLRVLQEHTIDRLGGTRRFKRISD